MSETSNLNNIDVLKPDTRFKVDKGWGEEDWVRNTEKYCQKRLLIKKEKKLSLHYHKLKDEVFYLITPGTVELRVYADPDLDQFVENWDNFYNGVPNAPPWLESPKIIVMEQWDSFHIPVGLRHTVKAFEQDAMIMEASTQHFDSDSIRVLKGD